MNGVEGSGSMRRVITCVVRCAEASNFSDLSTVMTTPEATLLTSPL